MTPDNWHESNKIYLLQQLARVKHKLRHKITADNDEASEHPTDLTKSTANTAHFALEIIRERFKLSPFEKDILLLCAGMEIERSWSLLCGQAQGSEQTNYPTFSLALSALDNPYWNSIAPDAPLRSWRLIEVKNNSNSLTAKELALEEQILHYLLGARHLDPRLSGLLKVIYQRYELVPSQQKIVDRLVKISLEAQNAPIINLYGKDATSKKAIATAYATELQLNLYQLAVEILPQDTEQINLLKCLLEREWLLNRSAFFLDCEPEILSDRTKTVLLSFLLDNLRCPVIISSRDRYRQEHQLIINLEVKKPLIKEQEYLWQYFFSNISEELELDTLTTYFNLNLPTIESICLQLKGSNLQSENINDELWQICRTQARPDLEQLAQRIESNTGWNDLVLPESELNTLKEIANHLRYKDRVYSQWGFASKNPRGLGINALFAGASGTGKTLAAEVLGNELQLDVYRIDLSTIVSKYIGETEKNLSKIFDIAEGYGAILLFDEADALFGKRSEVKDSRDRYANMEVSYLLQRIESYQGLAILTTNLKDDLDRAFLRRIRFTIQFPFPDFKQRLAIWQHAFPNNTPTLDLSFEKLAKLSVAGGNIRNIAINAAFMAAGDRQSIQMKHILQAAQSEYSKLEKPLTSKEIEDWI